MGKLDGKVAFISGIARGQGRAHALRLASEGADIAGFDLLEPMSTVVYPLATREDLDETVAMVEKTGRRCLAYQADVRDAEAVADVANRVLAELGHIDVVLANAGIGAKGMPFWEFSPDAWADVLAVNLTGVWNTVRAVAPAMIEAARGGSVIVTSSDAGLRAAPRIAAYNSSKRGAIPRRWTGTAP